MSCIFPCSFFFFLTDFLNFSCCIRIFDYHNFFLIFKDFLNCSSCHCFLIVHFSWHSCYQYSLFSLPLFFQFSSASWIISVPTFCFMIDLLFHHGIIFHISAGPWTLRCWLETLGCFRELTPGTQEGAALFLYVTPNASICRSFLWRHLWMSPEEKNLKLCLENRCSLKLGYPPWWQILIFGKWIYLLIIPRGYLIKFDKLSI